MTAQEGSLDVAHLLPQHHAPLDQPTTFGNTPLLRRHGTDPLKANTNSQTPLGLARLIANYDVAQFFAALP